MLPAGTLDPATLSKRATRSRISRSKILTRRRSYLYDDYNQFATLARSHQRSGILTEATGGVPERSRRYRELIRPLGLHGELRGAFVAGAAGWGAVGLLREPRAPDFSPHDAVFLRDVSGYIAHGIRTTLLLRSAARVRELTDEAFGQRRAVSEPAARPGRLSARELEVVRLMAEGLSNAQIAKRLVVSEFTVKRHVANILTKLDLPTRAAAAAYAAREGWV